MTPEMILESLFPKTWQGQSENGVFQGTATWQNQTVYLIGCVGGGPLDVPGSVGLAQAVLTVMQKAPKAPIFFLVDTNGQAATHSAELLGINRYYGHTCKVMHLARQQGHSIVGLVYGSALGGAFLGSGLNCGSLYALAEAKIAVMWLEAMARVTKIPLETLQALSQKSPVLAPGAQSYAALGALEIVSLEQLKKRLDTDFHKTGPRIRKNAIIERICAEPA